MNKVLILTASTGGGHNATSGAISTAFEEAGFETIIRDGVKDIRPLFNLILSSGYESSAKYIPKAYGAIYRLIDTPYLDQEHEVFINSLLKNKIKEIIIQENPDLIIGTHPFPQIAVASLKTAREIDIPIISVLTDYTSHSSWVKSGVDAFVVGADEMKYLMEEEGADSNKIYPLGIPVNSDFSKPQNPDLVREELCLVDKFTILLMGGSFGAGDFRNFLFELLDLKGNFQIIVVTGRNDVLKKKLERVVLEKNVKDTVQILGFTKNISELMSISDILVTKPGGLTTTEALLKQIPIVVPFFIHGAEEENVDFLLNHGLAVKTNRKYSLRVLVQSLMDHPERLQEMKRRMKDYAKPNSAADMVELGMKLMV